MAKPLIVDIPHDLGREEARRRIETGVQQRKGLLAKSGAALDRPACAGDRPHFGPSALAQKVEGAIDVGPESVRVEVKLPFLLAIFAEKIQKSLGKEGTLLLTKK